MRAIDMFAGWGGFTSGAEAAGASVVWAGNHWKLAVEAHAANHPNTLHVCQDLQQTDWSLLPAYDLLLASPACQGHSQAAQPVRKAQGLVRKQHDDLRATAWAVISCVDATRPKAVVVENVVDFTRWELFDLWLACFSKLGYQVEQKVALATDHGVPQRRKRVVIVATLGQLPDLTFDRPAVEPAFGPCVQWAEGRWRRVADAPAGAQQRMRRAVRNHGSRVISQHVTGHPGVPLDQAVRTITTKDQWVVVNGDVYRPFTTREYARAMGFCDTYRWPDGATRTDCIRGLGNAVPPPMAEAFVHRIMDAA
jgi:DNA (cytosine-5)-methyltransferase 1